MAHAFRKFNFVDYQFLYEASIISVHRAEERKPFHCSCCNKQKLHKISVTVAFKGGEKSETVCYTWHGTLAHRKKYKEVKTYSVY
jgi:hypothetical protein